MDRLRAGECSAEAGIMFGEVLNSLNRIGGHSINIAEAAVAQGLYKSKKAAAEAVQEELADVLVPNAERVSIVKIEKE